MAKAMIVVKDLYGYGIWKLVVPLQVMETLEKHPGKRWLWDMYEQDAVCLSTGQWFRETTGLAAPKNVDPNERLITWTSRKMSATEEEDLVSQLLDLSM